MKIREMTVGQATNTCWRYLWRGIIWVLVVEVAAYALDIPWSMRICALCITASFVDAMLRPTK